MTESTMTIEYGTQVWRLPDGCLHRENAPARIWPEGHEAWFLYGLFHRLDGPAIICADGSQAWWVRGWRITGEVEAWILDNDIDPDWKLWDDDIWALWLTWFS